MYAPVRLYRPIVQTSDSRGAFLHHNCRNSIVWYWRFGDEKPTRGGSFCRHSGFSRPSFDSDFFDLFYHVEAKVGFLLCTVKCLSIDPLSNTHHTRQGNQKDLRSPQDHPKYTLAPSCGQTPPKCGAIHGFFLCKWEHLSTKNI